MKPLLLVLAIAVSLSTAGDPTATGDIAVLECMLHLM